MTPEEDGIVKDSYRRGWMELMGVRPGMSLDDARRAVDRGQRYLSRETLEQVSSYRRQAFPERYDALTVIREAGGPSEAIAGKNVPERAQGTLGTRASVVSFPVGGRAIAG